MKQHDSSAVALPGKFLATSLVFFAIACAVGLALRAALVWPEALLGLSFVNVRHAHSHVAYFGWLSLAMMGAIYYLLPTVVKSPVRPSGLARVHLVLAALSTAGALVTFTLGGYSAASGVASTINMLTWYLFAFVVYRIVRARRAPMSLAATAMGLSVIFLTVASIAVWLVIAATTPRFNLAGIRDLALHFYLNVSSEGWFSLGLMGLVYALLPGMLGRELHSPRLGWLQVRLAAVAVIPASFAFVPADVATGPLSALGTVGAILLVVSEIIFLYNVGKTLASARSAERVEARELVAAAPPEGGRDEATPIDTPTGAPEAVTRPGRLFLVAALVALAVKTTLQLTYLAPGVRDIFGSVQFEVFYLHLALLGYASMAALAVVATLLSGLAPGRARSRLGSYAFLPLALGIGGMLLSLLATGTADTLRQKFGMQLDYFPTLTAATVFAAFAVVGVWVFALAYLAPRQKREAARGTDRWRTSTSGR